MIGPSIIARSLTTPTINDQYGNTWQYHSRSDRHSKIACWATLFDLLRECPVLLEHVSAGALSFGINHKMRDFAQNRRKTLDLVLCTPGPGAPAVSFASLVGKYGIVLSTEERRFLDTLPDLRSQSVGTVRVALEAKACMTEHSKARPRLYDELNSSHMTIHGDTNIAIAVASVLINHADRFRSPDRNRHKLTASNVVEVSHSQPNSSARVIEKVEQIRRRSSVDAVGFDALSIILVDCRNDGSRVSLVTENPAPPEDSIFSYEQTVRRVCELYQFRFGRV